MLGAARAAGAELGGARQDAHPGASIQVTQVCLIQSLDASTTLVRTPLDPSQRTKPLTPHPPNKITTNPKQNIVAASSKITEQEALYHARLTPVTDRLVGMAFPEPLEAVARLIGSRYRVSGWLGGGLDEGGLGGWAVGF